MATARQVADPYRELGVTRGADLAQIRIAYRALAKRYHPDAPGGDTVRFLAVQKAYLLLSDPLRRRDWDAKHAPGPVRANADPPPRPRRSESPRKRTSSSAPPPKAARPSSTEGETDAERREAWSASDRDPASRTHTWTADGVPWWNDFRSNGTRPTNGDGTPSPAASGGSEHVTPDADVYSRSSGAAWSMAARRYFRKGDADLPRRGVFRTRGTQVVTGAEARRVAEEEARRAARVEDLLRTRPGTAASPRQSFTHESPTRDRPSPRPPASKAPPAKGPAKPASPAPATRSTTNEDAARVGLRARMRRVLGLG
jgi:curved DNA-binding protein CbpA